MRFQKEDFPMPQEAHRKGRAVYIILLATIALIAATMMAGLHASASDLPGIVSRWSAEGNANDSVGSHNGMLQGGVTFASGIVGQAFNLDGTGAVQVPDSPSLNFGPQSPITIDFWVYRTDPSPV